MSEEKTLRRLMIPFAYDKKNIAKGDGRRYNKCEILHVGSHSDSISRTEIFYSAEELKKAALAITEKNKYFNLDQDKIYLNLDHEPSKVLSRIGYVYNVYFSNDSIKGDLYLHRLTSASKDSVALIDADFVSGLSVEILTRDVWEDHKLCAKDIELCGLSLVTYPADYRARVNK